MTKIEWNKKELNTGRDSSGVSNINSISGKDNGIKQGYTHGSLTKGLVAYYPMERGKGQIIRDAALNNTGQIKGAGWTNNSQVGDWVLEFDGDDDYVDLNDSNELQISESLTISAWINQKDTSGTQFLWGGIAEDNNSKQGDRLIRMFDDGEIDFERRPSDSTDDIHRQLTDNLEITEVDVWYHVVCTYDGSVYKIFVNGNEVDSTFSTTTSSWDGQPRGNAIGARKDGDDNFNGIIEDVCIYNRALSQPEIEALYNLSRPNGVEVTEGDVPSQGGGGVSRWRFDDDSDTDTATDSWGGNHGVISGAEYTSQRVYGSNALSFDGEGDNVNPNDIVTDDILNSGNEDVLTYSAWIKSDSTNSWSVFVGTRINYNFQITTDDTYSYILTYDDERNNIHVEGNTEIINGNWHHIVGIWDQGHIKLYIDGKLDATKKVPAPMSTNNDRIGIGGDIDNDTRYFIGKIDDVRIYNKALSPVEVEKLFKKGAYRINRGDLLQ